MLNLGLQSKFSTSREDVTVFNKNAIHLEYDTTKFLCKRGRDRDKRQRHRHRETQRDTERHRETEREEIPDAIIKSKLSHLQ